VGVSWWFFFFFFFFFFLLFLFGGWPLFFSGGHEVSTDGRGKSKGTGRCIHTLLIGAAKSTDHAATFISPRSRTFLIKDDQIVSVGRSRDRRRAAVIDASGRLIVPCSSTRISIRTTRFAAAVEEHVPLRNVAPYHAADGAATLSRKKCAAPTGGARIRVTALRHHHRAGHLGLNAAERRNFSRRRHRWFIASRESASCSRRGMRTFPRSLWSHQGTACRSRQRT